MITYVLMGVIIILSALFGLYAWMVKELIKSSDEYTNASREYIEALERYVEILQSKDYIKMVTNAKEAEEYPIMSEDTSKRFEEFFKMIGGEEKV